VHHEYGTEQDGHDSKPCQTRDQIVCERPYDNPNACRYLCESHECSNWGGKTHHLGETSEGHDLAYAMEKKHAGETNTQ
jgi:hypothetical protein